jgi:DNA-binding transcriptional LysR family regulator
MVLDGHLELGVVGAKWNENKLEWIEMFSDELILAVHPNHHWAQRDSVSLQEVIKEPFILRESESGTRKAFAQVLKNYELKENDIQEIAEIGSTAAVKEAVKAGIGVAILSQYAVKDDVACGRLVTIRIKEQRLRRPFYLIKRKNKALPPVASTFFEYLQERAVEKD